MRKSARAVFILSVSAALSCLSSCDLPAFPWPPAIPADVYIAGAYTDAGIVNHACYWVNSQQHIVDSTASTAHSIFVDGSDIYLAGATGSTSSMACYWLNSTRHDLETTASYAGDIEEVSGTIYVLGWANDGITDTTRFWTITDAGATITTTDFAKSGTVDRVLISGTDVYVAGTYIGAGNHEAYYKKNNGSPVTCPGAAMTVTGLWVDGADVYVCGQTEDDAYYWKNGATVDLNRDAHTSAITTSGSDVYTAGYLIDVVAPTTATSTVIYWKNTNAWQLPGDDAIAASIQVIGEDVYAAGWCNYQHAQTACYWINGARTDLPGPSGYFTSWAEGMVVVPK